MGVIGRMHTYNLNFLLKPFTNHLLLLFLYVQVIINQSISAQTVISCLFFLLVKHASVAILESRQRQTACTNVFIPIDQSVVDKGSSASISE